MSGSGEHKDALPQGKVRGRGAGLNPGNRFESIRLHVLGEHLDEQAAANPEGVQAGTVILADHTRTVLNRVDSPDLPGMQWSLNPYRGCEHGCIYCYARPTHEYLGFSSGLDFETRIVAKHDAPKLLRAALRSPKWKGDSITLSGVTDPYQPVEEKLRITRGCLEVMLEMGQRVALISKNRLVLRDLDLLTKLNERGLVGCAVSITTLDRTLAARMEPRAASPKHRLEVVRRLAEAGIPVTVMVAPVVPGLTDSEMPRILEAAKEAGASGAGFVLLRLPYQIKALFLEWLQRHYPDRAGRVESLVRETRGGELYKAAFHERHRGEGAYAEHIARTFEVFVKRYGLNRNREAATPPRPRERPVGEGTLFEGLV